MYVSDEAVPEVDRPPVGTPCERCRTLGHFCQATEYMDDKSDEGQCHSCLEAEDCPVVAAKKQTQDDPFSIPRFPADERVDMNSALVREYLMDGLTSIQIARKTGLSDKFIERVKADYAASDEAITKAENVERRGRLPGAIYKPEKRQAAAALLESGSSTREVAAAVGLARNTVREVRKEVGITEPANSGGAPTHKHKYAAEIERATELRIGEITIFRAVNGMTLNEYAKSLLGELCTHPSTRDGYWKTQAVTPSNSVRLTRMDPDVEQEGLPEMCGCGRPATHMGRCKSRRELEKRNPSTHLDSTIDKSELKVITPVTIVTVPAEPKKQDMGLSRALELVRRELYAWNESLRDEEDDEEFAASIKKNEEIIGILHDTHPAFLGFRMTSEAHSVYDRARDQAESELQLIEMEIHRLTTRRDALKPILAALNAGHNAERDTR